MLFVDLPALILVLLSALVLYLLAGYPFLLWLQARWRSWPVARQPYEPAVDVLLAVHNGERYITGKLASLAALEYPPEKLQVLVVSDGSTDQTDTLVEEAAALPVWQGRLRLIRVGKGGKCRAINAGLPHAHRDIIVFTDVRQTLESPSLRLLMENFADPQVGVASGALTILDGDSLEEASTGLYWKYELWIRRQLSRRDSIFGATGALYAMRRNLVRPLPGGALLDDMHLPLAAFFEGYRLIVDERARMFDRPTAVRDEFSRKARTLAGNFEILYHYPRLLCPGWMGGNRLWGHFLSYKCGRLLLPWLLLAAFVCSVALAPGWRESALVLQIGFYMLAATAPWLPGFLGRLGGAARAFCALMLAGLAAPFWLMKPEGRRWRTR